MFLLTLACATAVPETEDIAFALAEMGLPPGTPCAEVTRSSTTPGHFGREGLRIEGTCAPAPGWQPAGWASTLPTPVASFPRPPLLGLPEHGLAFCVVGTWITGQSFTRLSCDSPPARFDQYRLAVWDPEARTVRFVLQNLY